MSPEQADPTPVRHRHAQRCLLAGRAALRAADRLHAAATGGDGRRGLLELLRMVREVEPPRPSVRLAATEELPAIAANRGLEPKKLGGLVRGELDWIVMKCLEKDRARRYETPGALARDIQRYLADEPVEASPPSAGLPAAQVRPPAQGRAGHGGGVRAAPACGRGGQRLAGGAGAGRRAQGAGRARRQGGGPPARAAGAEQADRRGGGAAAGATAPADGAGPAIPARGAGAARGVPPLRRGSAPRAARASPTPRPASG